MKYEPTSIGITGGVAFPELDQTSKWREGFSNDLAERKQRMRVKLRKHCYPKKHATKREMFANLYKQEAI